MEYIIGVDFDNTLVNYDDLIYAVALERGLIQTDIRKNKKTIRDTIRKLPDGESEWQRLQAIMYGPRIKEAALADGVKTFFRLCKRHKSTVYVISHKTEYAAFDETGTNLRAAAMTWMKTHFFFEADGLGLSPQSVYFEATRQEKIERIRQLRCTHFIDDLEETFLEDSFPTDVEKLLYAPNRQYYSPLGGVRVLATWKDISEYFKVQLKGASRM
jgi:hypothetical protein